MKSEFKNTPAITKREFITSWSQETVDSVRHLPLNQARFFEDTKSDGVKHAIIPDNIAFRDLMSLPGKKTKVTIEVLS